MQATARRLSVVSATSCARRRLIRDVRPSSSPDHQIKIMTTRQSLIGILAVCFLSTALYADKLNDRELFGTTAANSFSAALKRADQSKKRLFLIYWDSKEKGNYPGLEIRYFCELKETKKLLRDNFVIVLLDQNNPDAVKYHPKGNVEKAHWVLINPDGTVVQQAEVYGNPKVGLETVQKLVKLPK